MEKLFGSTAKKGQQREGGDGGQTNDGNDNGGNDKPQMRNLEIFKHSLLLGLSNSTDDFDEYYLYFMLPLGYGCNNINLVFASLNVVHNIFSFINNALAGYIVDATENYQHIALWACSSLLLFSAISLMYFGPIVGIPILCVMFVVHQFSSTLMETLIFKVVKMRAQVLIPSIRSLVFLYLCTVIRHLLRLLIVSYSPYSHRQPRSKHQKKKKMVYGKNNIEDQVCTQQR